LIVLIALLSGGLLLGVGSILLSGRGGSAPSPNPSPVLQTSGASGRPATPTPPPLATAKAPLPDPAAAASGGAWGSASDYKFGRLPDGEYPNSCAFSRTDAAGERASENKSSLEFWACRDRGGDPERGYSVVWADGKQTTYTFAADGSGTVVGTNGLSYSMRWRNDSHQGSDIVVIDHKDGAISWIPGPIRDPQD
jgi:hypothetical protein